MLEDFRVTLRRFGSRWPRDRSRRRRLGFAVADGAGTSEQPRDFGRERGFVLVALSLSIFFLLGVVGLAIDVGRMYVVKNESQSFCDSAAMFAANELNGTSAGVTAAANRATWVTQDPNGPLKGLEFNTRQFQNTTTTFATAWDAASWVDTATAAASPANYYFARVETHNPVSLWFLAALVGSTAGSVGASAVAGRALESTMVQGLAPFAPFQMPAPGPVCTEAELVGCTLDPANTYGLKKGQWYTIRWLAGNLKASEIPEFCPGDQCECMRKLANESGAASAGYALYHGAADIRQAIIGTPPLSTPITLGSTLDLQNGQVNTEMSALNDRVAQDSDTTSNHYYGPPIVDFSWRAPVPTANSYAGNGRRIMVMPIQSAAGAIDGSPKLNDVVGFGGFLLGPLDSYVQGHASTAGACAQYLGEFTVGVPGSGGTGPGGNTVNTLRLFR
jgi:Flp pilus assembly protein TadG